MDIENDDLRSNYESEDFDTEEISEEEEIDENQNTTDVVEEFTRTPDSASEFQKTCWVCFGNESDELTSYWIHPCRCRGTTKWIHHNCLMRWVDEKQKRDSYAKVMCPQCSTEYVIIFPPFDKFCKIIQALDRLIYKTSPFLATGMILGSVYWTAVTYGAITVMQVLGHKEGLNMMEQADPLFLLLGLPAIPVGLVLGKMIQWDEYLLRVWRRHASKFALINFFFPDYKRGAVRPIQPPEAPAKEIKFSRVFCGAMFFPTIATIIGKVAFRRVNGNLQRSILGGIAFVAIKGVFKVYLKQQMYSRLGCRSIADFDETTHGNGA